MGMENHDVVIENLKKIPGYVSAFKKAFPEGESMTIQNLAKAIASYERTLITPNSAYDRFRAGDTKAMSASAQRGMVLVKTIGCTSCHMGALFSGPTLPMGTGFYQKFPVHPDSKLEAMYGFSKDLGRFEVTKKASDKNFWRVSTWRNVELTAPYFHNGSVATLDEAVAVMAKTQLNKTLRPEQVKDVVAFLKCLTGERPKQSAPTLPPNS